MTERRFFGIAVVLFAGLNMASPHGHAQCQLTVGWEPWPPYQYQSEDGTVVGLDADLMRAIADEMPCELEWVPATWKRQLERMKSGKQDAAVGASYTEDRTSWGRYSGTFRESVNHLVVAAALDGRYDSLEAFLSAGHTLGFMQDYHYGPEVMALLQSEAYADQLEATVATEANLLKLATGRVDGILMDAFVAASLKRGLDSAKAARVGDQSIAVSGDDLHVLFSRASVSEDTADRFDAVLERLKADGTIQAIVDRYMH